MSNYDHRLSRQDMHDLQQELSDLFMEYPPNPTARQKGRMRRIAAIMNRVWFHDMPHDGKDYVIPADGPTPPELMDDDDKDGADASTE